MAGKQKRSAVPYNHYLIAFFMISAFVFTSGAMTGMISVGEVGNCNGTVYSDVYADLEVDSGNTCIIRNGTVVDGRITVDGGTLVVMENSLVKNKIEGNGYIRIENSTVDSNVEIEEGGNLTIGNSTVANTIESKGGGYIVIESSVVDDQIEIRDAGSLAVKNSVIGGSIEGKDGAFVTIDNSGISGNIIAKDEGGNLSLAGSDVTGKVETEGQISVEIRNNTMGDDVGSKDDITVVVTGNIISGDLGIENPVHCTENGNLVSGTNSGCPSEPVLYAFIGGMLQFVIKDGDTTISTDPGSDHTLYFSETNLTDYALIKNLTDDSYDGALANADADESGVACSPSSYATRMMYYDENNERMKQPSEKEVFSIVTDSNGCFVAKVEPGSWDLYS